MWLSFRSGPLAGQTVEVGGASFVIGRDPSCDLHLEDGRVSREHAALQATGGAAELTDLDSSNGTFVDGARITGTAWRAPR